MKSLIRIILLNSLSIFIVTLLFKGFWLSGGYENYLYAALLLSVISIVLDPVVKVLTLPFNILTLGLLSFISTLIALFIVTIVFHQVHVTSFTLEGISLFGFSTSRIYLSHFLSYVVISGTIYFLNKLISWIFSTK